MYFNSLSLKTRLTALALLLSFICAPLTMYAQVSNYQPRTQLEMIAYLYGILAQLQAQLAELKAAEARGETRTTSTRVSPNPFFVNVVSLAPTSIDRSSAILNGEVDKGGSEYLEVWFQYGVGDGLTRTKDLEPIVWSGRQPVSATLKDLRSNTTYSYRLVAEDERGYRHYGQTRTFTTVSSPGTQSFSGRPYAETEGSTNTYSAGATVGAFVSMNDYDLGNVFFVYGIDRSDVDVAEDYDSYNEIPVADGVIMKLPVNWTFTGRNTVVGGIYGLRPATRYYYRVCVEYSKNSDGINPSLSCGQIESFTTLN